MNAEESQNPSVSPEPIIEETPEITPQPAEISHTQPEPAPVVESQPPISQPPVQSPQPSPKSFLAKALESIQFRKKAKLEKIMKSVQEKGSITNDQVEKLIHVSDATATRYLSELTRQNRLKRVGMTSGIQYEPVGSFPTD